MSAIDKIITWANDLPDWQADAVRRFLEQGALTDEDRNELYQMMKVAAGIESTCKPPVPPRIGAISGSVVTQQPIALQRISDVNHVSAIENGSTIPFAHEGITVIYGENGSGKSSYARVLKKACRARDSKEPILSNVFESDEQGPASATIKIIEGTTKGIELPWVDGADADRRLSSVTFFDSKCARVIVDENNDAEYIPYGCEVFDCLAKLLTDFKARLAEEKPRPAFPSNTGVTEHTEAGLFLKNLSRNTKLADINKACEWGDSENTKLESFVGRIASSTSANLTKEAKRIQLVADVSTGVKARIFTAVRF